MLVFSNGELDYVALLFKANGNMSSMLCNRNEYGP